MHGLKPLVWIVWMGLIMIGAEVRHLHAKILSQPAAALPLAFCAFAAIVVPVCLSRVTQGSRRFLLMTFGFGALVGILGVYFHTKFRIEPFLQLLTADSSPGPQPLVPLSFTGLCTLGALATRLLPDEARRPKSATIAGRLPDRQ